METDEPQLRIDPNPSPKDEARDFQNSDERRLAATHSHELAMIDARRGLIGRLTGSTNDSMNTGLFILVCGLLLLAGSMVGGLFRPEAFSGTTDNLFKFVLTVSGYVFGTKVAQKE
jgi:hypothetical protein